MSHLATIAEADHEYAHEVGRQNRGQAWILSDRDVWYRNPFYTGPAVRHPEDDYSEEDDTVHLYAECYLTRDRYNHVLRATVPGCWVVRFLDRLPFQSEASPQAEFYGNTRREAIENARQALRNNGLSGVLHLTKQQ